MFFAAVQIVKTALTQPSLAVSGDQFCHIFHPYDTPIFKTKMLCLVSDEGWMKRLLLLAK